MNVEMNHGHTCSAGDNALLLGVVRRDHAHLTFSSSERNRVEDEENRRVASRYRSDFLPPRGARFRFAL